jgi:flagellar basal-body rod protein FlgF
MQWSVQPPRIEPRPSLPIMTSITAITLGALLSDQARMERVASNIANATTPGYRREILVESVAEPSPFAELVLAGEARAAKPVSSSKDAIVSSTLERDSRPGTLRPTGRSLDLAIAGPGYFELATEQGPVWTRLGQFQVDGRGRLVNAQGHALVGTGGEITVTSDKVSIDTEGRITESGQLVGQVRVVDWDAKRLSSTGNGTYVGTGPTRQVEPGHVAIRQGFVENSNVDTAHEMVSLMATTRHFEATLRMLQGLDDMLGTAIRRLGET